ncbi:hypothetical protein DV20_33350 [Amycolatopsis rifamycinica]|uniref:Secreted protein n=1 Tax=Amycolatopsis rifamycinica TaxID=287986 RepID=A0A066TSA6_9PSEU|nr:hypothetical protein DV20_33350 [Amycolatopsis rifamycinica]
MSRVAGVVFAGALATFAATPAALAQTDTSPASETTTTTTTAEPATTTVPSSTETTAPASPATTTAGTTSAAARTEVTTTSPPTTTSSAPEPAEPPKDDYQDNAGHGFVGLGGEGVLVIACAAAKPGAVATQYLSVTGGPDQDESDGRYWNYSVRVVDAPAGTTTAKFSWTCDNVEGNGIVEFEREGPPASTTTSSSSSPSSTAPVTTAPITTGPITTATGSAPAGNAAPAAQVKVAPRGGIETGFGGTAR